MKFCPECGAKLSETQKFCSECGTDLREILKENEIKSEEKINEKVFDSNNEIEIQTFGGISIESFDFNNINQNTKQVDLNENELKALEPFETVKLSDGTYVIKKLKNKSEIIVTVPSCVSVIGDEAFAETDILEITLSEGLVKIGNRAFANCRDLDKINFPKTLHMIGDEAFIGCSQFELTIPSNIRCGKDVLKGTKSNINKQNVVRKLYIELLTIQIRKTRNLNNHDSFTIELYKKAAKYGIAEAQYLLGKCYNEGEGVIQNNTEAFKWYKLASAQGNADAQNELGISFETGRGIVKSYIDAVKWYLSAAEQENVEAQYVLCLLYNQGRRNITTDEELIPKNFDESKNWFLKAAEQGHMKAQYELGNLYFFRYNDENQSIKWWIMAANQGNCEAQNSLGEYYCFGLYNDGPINKLEGMQWFTRAAEQGNKEAQRQLGDCYFESKNYIEAVKWYIKSAEQCNEYAQYALGKCYEYGYGLTKNKEEAIKWYRKAHNTASWLDGPKEALKRLGEK